MLTILFLSLKPNYEFESGFSYFLPITDWLVHFFFLYKSLPRQGGVFPSQTIFRYDDIEPCVQYSGQYHSVGSALARKINPGRMAVGSRLLDFRCGKCILIPKTAIACSG